MPKRVQQQCTPANRIVRRVKKHPIIRNTLRLKDGTMIKATGTFARSDLITIGNLGAGAFGTVKLAVDRKSG